MDDSKKPVTQLLDLEKTIKTYHASIASKREELKKLNQMIKDTFEKDEVYAQHAEDVLETKRILKGTKDQLMSVSSVVSTQEDIKELRTDVRDMQKNLSELLMKYYNLASTNNITMDDGETYLIETKAKLVKQK